MSLGQPQTFDSAVDSEWMTEAITKALLSTASNYVRILDLSFLFFLVSNRDGLQPNITIPKAFCLQRSTWICQVFDPLNIHEAAKTRKSLKAQRISFSFLALFISTQ